jgi:hypothetical protein
MVRSEVEKKSRKVGTRVDCEEKLVAAGQPLPRQYRANLKAKPTEI